MFDTIEDMVMWEKENQDKITGWVAEYTTEYKIVTYQLVDKTKKVFNIQTH